MGKTQEIEVINIEKKFAKAYFNLVESGQFDNLTVSQLKEVVEYLVGTYDQGYEAGLNAANKQKENISRTQGEITY